MIKNLLYVVTDGILDDLARKSIIGASNIYHQSKPMITIATLNSDINPEDPLFSSIHKDSRINVLKLTEQDLIKVFPNLMQKRLVETELKTKVSHWENAKEKNQHLAEFSDLAIFYMMHVMPDLEFLYMDSDILPIMPMQSENSFVVAKDIGIGDKEYINSSFILVPKGYKDVKQRWISFLENEILNKYAGRYGTPGPTVFDKFLNKPEELLGFPLKVLESNVINKITFTEMHEAALKSIENDKPLLLDIDHNGPGLNIPRSAITSAITKKEVKELEVLLGLVTPQMAQVIDFKFYPKQVKGITYYD
jgi:hypothetical protein